MPKTDKDGQDKERKVQDTGLVEEWFRSSVCPSTFNWFARAEILSRTDESAVAPTPLNPPPVEQVTYLTAIPPEEGTRAGIVQVCQILDKSAFDSIDRTVHFNRPASMIRSTSPRKATVSEMISEQEGSLIHSQRRQLERWAEYFEGQFSWSPATQTVEITHTGEQNVNLDRLSEEIKYELSVLKREEVPRPEDLYSALSNESRIPGDLSTIAHYCDME
ncbi:hypothetical protein T265_00645 [Opisthorchis viverrini]|uniref:Uncharacterized protein n=1 Tax=Opisthorchis viverrini TaxID=6198 RepID=A0A075ACC3_OPIVI|nr:hypothetical protein T265_00645 [Opisthorchis viverrini]KER33535.1 hypothetical protein T265_00645 [Opisthorchis viverrini]